MIRSVSQTSWCGYGVPSPRWRIVGRTGAGFQDVGVEGDAVNDRGHESRVGEHAAPSLKGRLVAIAMEISEISLGAGPSPSAHEMVAGCGVNPVDDHVLEFPPGATTWIVQGHI